MFSLILPVYQVLERLAGVAADIRPDGNVRVFVTSEAPAVNADLNGTGLAVLAQAKAKAESLRDFSSVECSQAFIEIADLSFRLKYGIDQNLAHFSFERPGNDALALAAVRSLHKHFDLQTRTAAFLVAQGDRADTAIKMQQLAVGQMEVHTAKLADLVASQAKEQAKNVQDLSDKLRKDHDEQSKRLEDKYAADVEKLSKEREVFEAKSREFDLNEAKYVRRKLLGESRDQSAKAGKIVSKSTSNLRLWIHVIFVVVLGIAGAGVYYAGKRVLLSSQFDWRNVAEAAACSITFVSFAIYYIHWNDQWFSDHAQIEFSNHRFNLDILRASWLAELLFEWDKEKSSEFPRELINAFGQNLFHPYSRKQSEHPIEQIAGMMGDFSKVRVGKSGVELERIKEKDPKKTTP